MGLLANAVTLGAHTGRGTMEGVQGGQQPVFSPPYISWQKSRVWVVTFISYTCFHLARKVRDSSRQGEERAPTQQLRRANSPPPNNHRPLPPSARIAPYAIDGCTQLPGEVAPGVHLM